MIEFQSTWGWPAALYLFLGGLGAGMFAAASGLLVLGRKRHRAAVAAAYGLATLCLAVGLLALLWEVGSPLRALVLPRSFTNMGSWMARGAWVVIMALAVCALAAALASKRASKALARAWRWLPGAPKLPRKQLLRVCAVAGSVLAMFVAFYTGALLASAPGVPFWNSWLLPVLFTVSALGAGANAVAALTVITGSARKVSRVRRRLFAYCSMGVAVAEGAVLTVYLVGMLQGWGALDPVAAKATAVSAHALVAGSLAVPFWALAVGLGLVGPVVTSAVSLFVRKRAGLALVVVGAAGALAGECALRFLFLYAGASADYVGSTLAEVVSIASIAAPFATMF